MRVLKEHSDWPLEVDNNQLRGSLKMSLLQLHKSCPRTQMSTILRLFSIWSKLEKWQISISGCPMSWLKVKKALFWSIFSYSMQQKQTISRSYYMWWKVDFVPQLAMTSSVVGPWSSKALPKTKLAPKNRSWSLFGCLWPVWPTTAFWIPEKPLHLRTMLSKLMSTENCNAWSWHWSTERAQFCTTIPNCRLHNSCLLQKLKELDYEIFASSTLFTWPLNNPNWLLLLQSSWQLFSQGKCFHNQQEAENIFQEFIESPSTDFYTTGISKLISYCKKYVDCNGCYFS